MSDISETQDNNEGIGVIQSLLISGRLKENFEHSSHSKPYLHVLIVEHVCVSVEIENITGKGNKSMFSNCSLCCYINIKQKIENFLNIRVKAKTMHLINFPCKELMWHNLKHFNNYFHYSTYVFH